MNDEKILGNTGMKPPQYIVLSSGAICFRAFNTNEFENFVEF